jgi:putative ABC transport system permease protein
MSMIRNYLIIAIRNISRSLSFTMINIAGLSLAITCSIVLFLFITFFTSFDNYHADGDRIYRIVTTMDWGRVDYDHTPGVPAPFPEALKADATGIESVLFISGRWRALVSVEDDGERRMFEEEGSIGYTDSTYFNFFTRNIVAGEASLTKPNQAVISRKWAEKYFGEKDPIGKVIRIDNAQDFEIIGVMEDYPPNTSFPFELLMSYETIRKEKIDAGWYNVWSDDQCYIKLLPGVTPASIEAQLADFIKKYINPEEASHMKRWLQPLKDINHDTRVSNYRQRTVGRESIWAMGAIMIFLLITGCINFINLSTAVAVRRSKEVGIRKVLGGQRTQLVFQYLSETAVVTLIAIVLSVGLAELALVKLNAFQKLDLHIDLTSPGFLGFIVTIWLVVSIISGLYPSFLLSGFSPAMALRNKITNRGSGGFALRRGLVVFQFVISQVLVIGTIVLLSQMNYFNNKDLGFSKEAVVLVPLPQRDNVTAKTAVRAAVRDLPGVESVSLCNTPPSSGAVSVTDFRMDGLERTDNVAHVKIVDWAYLDLFDIDLVAGRPFDDIDTANAWIVNETLVKWVGMEPEEILGRNLTMWERTLPVIGVVRDFHTMSLARTIEPTVLMKDPPGYWHLAVKVKPGQFNTTIDEIEKVWATQYPDFLFSYEFLEEEIANFYRDTHRLSVLLILFSCVAIFISCLGLYGLVSYIATRKEKEIGVRKAFGASTAQIAYIFSREFLVLIVIAFVVAAPASGFVMEQWLQNFAYRISLEWFMFAAGIGVTLLVAGAAVGYRSLRAALARPADVLRNE